MLDKQSRHFHQYILVGQNETVAPLELEHGIFASDLTIHGGTEFVWPYWLAPSQFP